MKILQVSPQDLGGGAEKVALDLHQSFRRHNIDGRLFVRFRRTKVEEVYEINPFAEAAGAARVLGFVYAWLGRRSHFRGRDTIRTHMASIAHMLSRASRPRDQEHRSDSWPAGLLSADGWKPDVLHLHNVHDSSLDLEKLPAISRAVPLIWTLHDTWAFTGHCGYFIDCGRWRSGCGNCPDLRRAPAVSVDHTAQNMLRKRDIYSRSVLHLVCPSRWLRRQLEESFLAGAEVSVIPYGIDLQVYRPAEQRMAREQLRLPQDAFICLFAAASGSATNPYKDYSTIRDAVNRLRYEDPGSGMRFICLGGKQQPSSGDGGMIFPGMISDSRQMALYYQASDLLLHAANADNFPCAVLEAQASGLPVVATAVGGIPEQVEDGGTGFLVPRGDSAAMSERIQFLMKEGELRNQMRLRAAERARKHFDLESQAADYLELYNALLAAFRRERRS